MTKKPDTLILKDERNQQTLELEDRSGRDLISIRLALEQNDIPYVFYLKEKEARQIRDWLTQALE